jgi:hypothetical protein
LQLETSKAKIEKEWKDLNEKYDSLLTGNKKAEATARAADTVFDNKALGPH